MKTYNLTYFLRPKPGMCCSKLGLERKLNTESYPNPENVRRGVWAPNSVSCQVSGVMQVYYDGR